MLYPYNKKILSLNKQKGAAIIVALFVVALVAAAAIMMIERLRTDIRRTQLTLNSNTAYLYAQGSVLWAIEQLNTNWKQQQPNRVIDKMPIVSSVDTKNGFKIHSIISDAQGFFNINNVADPQYKANFSRLLSVIIPSIEPANAESITQAILDWITSNASNPVQDEYYLKMNPPYRSAHKMMASISELRLVKGISAELFNQLSPYLIALPDMTPINFNNAAPPVLMSLSMTLTPDAAKSLAATCQKTPFATVESFSNFDIVKNNPIDPTKITATSNYFLLRTDVTLGKQTLTLYTLLERSTQEKQSNTIVVWQSIGTL